jgi:hypothetical protein
MATCPDYPNQRGVAAVRNTAQIFTTEVTEQNIHFSVFSVVKRVFANIVDKSACLKAVALTLPMENKAAEKGA